MDIATILLYALAVLAVVSGFMLLVTREIVRVAFWLLGSLSGVAGLYVALDADFLAATQVIVYIGGIMVLILFGIMMTNRDRGLRRAEDRGRRSVFTGILVAIGTFIITMAAIAGVTWPMFQPDGAVAPVAGKGAPTTAALGEALLTDYILPFELVSVLLLIVLCGAAYIARRTRGGPSDA